MLASILDYREHFGTLEIAKDPTPLNHNFSWKPRWEAALIIVVNMLSIVTIIIIIVINILSSSGNVDVMVGDRLTICDFCCQDFSWLSRKWENFWQRSPQLQKDPHPRINSPQTPHSCAPMAPFIGSFRPDLILVLRFKTGVICCSFYSPPAFCFAINSRYEGRANKTAIVRAIRAITPDKPLPKCSSASSKSNQIIKQPIEAFTRANWTTQGFD